MTTSEPPGGTGKPPVELVVDVERVVLLLELLKDMVELEALKVMVELEALELEAESAVELLCNVVREDVVLPVRLVVVLPVRLVVVLGDFAVPDVTA